MPDEFEDQPLPFDEDAPTDGVGTFADVPGDGEILSVEEDDDAELE